MTLDDIDMLGRLAVQASIKPCQVSRADLLRLLPLVGFEPANLVWQDVLNADETMLVMPDAVLMMIEMARSRYRIDAEAIIAALDRALRLQGHIARGDPL